MWAIIAIVCFGLQGCFALDLTTTSESIGGESSLVLRDWPDTLVVGDTTVLFIAMRREDGEFFVPATAHWLTERVSVVGLLPGAAPDQKLAVAVGTGRARITVDAYACGRPDENLCPEISATGVIEVVAGG